MATELATLKRDLKVISLISIGHCISHVYQLALPNLFFLIMKIEGYGIGELALLTSIFFVVSSFSQVGSGFLVDRYGARPVLFIGLFLLALATGGFALFNNYPAMIVLSFLGGLGNSVFHPADYSILNGSISESRVGRAYAIHGFGGLIGYAVTPYGMYLMGSSFGWQTTMLILCIFGVVVGCIMWLLRHELQDSGVDKGKVPGPLRSEIGILFKPATIYSFLFFCFMAMGSIGLMTLGPNALSSLLDIPTEKSSFTISLQLMGSLFGILLGGIIADKIVRHDLATASIVTFGVCLLWTVPVFQPNSLSILLPIFILFGFSYGMAQPSRDMVVRSVAPSGAAGKVFGFTYSGMDFGSAIAATVFGFLLSEGEAQTVFILVGVFMMLGVMSVLLAKFTGKKTSAALAE